MSALFRTLVFTIFVPGFWTVAMPYWILPRGARLDLRGVGLFGLLLMASGAALYFVTAFWGFALRGGGTPAPIDPPKKLVVEGPYRVVRNPMYWAVASVVMGEALAFRSVTLAELAWHYLQAQYCLFCSMKNRRYDENLARSMRRIAGGCRAGFLDLEIG